MPSSPRRAASRASSTCWMPLTRIGSEVALAQPFEVVPGQGRVDVDAQVVAGRGAQVLLRRLLQAGSEDRVLEEVGVAGPFEEGEPGLLQVTGLPARDEGVDRDHDRLVARRLGASDEALDQAPVVGPVELKPAGRLASGLRDLLQREVRCGAGDHRHPQRRCGTRGCQLAVLVDDLLHADRGEHQRRRHPGAEHLHREVARRRRRATFAARSGAVPGRRGWPASSPRRRLRR